MNTLDKYIRKPIIKKTIDDSTGTSPRDIFTQDSQGVAPDSVTRVQDQTPTKQVVADLSDHTVEAKNQTTQVLNDIVGSNATDPVFSAYAQAASQLYFDPSTLLTDPNSRPNIPPNPATVKLLERDVYQRVRDPRAPFVRDLYRVQAEIGTIMHTIERVWRIYGGINNLYTITKDNNYAKLSLLKYRQRLELLQLYGQQINQLKEAALDQDFYDGLGDWFNTPDNSLNAVGALLSRNLVSLSGFWGEAQDALDNVLGHPLQNVWDSAFRAQSQAVLSGVRDPILDLSDRLQSRVERGSLQIAEFKNQLESALFELTQSSEEELLWNERVLIQSNEARKQLLNNTMKASYAKKFIVAIDAMRGITAKQNSPVDTINAVASAVQAISGVAIKLPSKNVLNTALTLADDLKKSGSVINTLGKIF